jgi:hypothetical protein
LSGASQQTSPEGHVPHELEPLSAGGIVPLSGADIIPPSGLDIMPPSPEGEHTPVVWSHVRFCGQLPP